MGRSSYDKRDVSYSLNSLKGVKEGIIWGNTMGIIMGDTRNLDYSSCGLSFHRAFSFSFPPGRFRVWGVSGLGFFFGCGVGLEILQP